MSCSKLLAFSVLGLFFLSIMALPALAVSPDIALEKYSGVGYDIWMDSGSEVGITGLFVVVNYHSDAMDFRVDGKINATGEKKSYALSSIPSESSQIIQVDFADVGCTYSFTLWYNSTKIFEVSKYRTGSYLAPTNDNQWHWTPPIKYEEAKKYTQTAWDSVISSITLNIILITSGIVMIGACIGIAIKLFTRFLVPTDFLSWGFYLTLIVDAAHQMLPFEFNRLWYVPLLIGYWIGFMLWHIPYVMPVRIDSENKHLQVRPYVLYYPEDKNKPCVQVQTNRALVARIFGHHHELISNGGLNPDWEIFVKKPYWPRIVAPTLWLQKTDTKITIKKWWRFKFKDVVTQWSLANASMMPRYKWLVSTDAFYKATELLDWSETERTKYSLTHQFEAVKSAAGMIGHSVEVSPIEAIKRQLDEKEKPIVESLDEHKLTVFDDTEKEVPEVDTEAESDSEVDKRSPRDRDEEESEEAEEDRKARRKNGGRKDGH